MRRENHYKKMIREEFQGRTFHCREFSKWFEKNSPSVPLWQAFLALKAEGFIRRIKGRTMSTVYRFYQTNSTTPTEICRTCKQKVTR